jgi:hypothetical protein
MSCPLCQNDEYLTAVTPLTGYCNKIMVFYRDQKFDYPHYEYVLRYEGMTPYRTEIVRVAPFVISRMENGNLQVIISQFPNSQVVVQKDDTLPEDLLRYYHRFQKLGAFI